MGMGVWGVMVVHMDMDDRCGLHGRGDLGRKGKGCVLSLTRRVTGKRGEDWLS